MPMTNVARNVIATALTGGAFDPFDNANAYIGVGNSSTGFDPAHTDLIGTNERMPMKPGKPARSANMILFESRFLDADGVFAWNEFGVFNAATGGEMLNRIVTSVGTKPDDEIWDVEIIITVERGT